MISREESVAAYYMLTGLQFEFRHCAVSVGAAGCDIVAILHLERNVSHSQTSGPDIDMFNFLILWNISRVSEIVRSELFILEFRRKEERRTLRLYTQRCCVN